VILIVGASGLLGSNLAFVCSQRGLPFHGTYLSQTMTDPRGCFSRRDLRIKREVEALLSEVSPDVVMNCSAYTNLDGAEKSPDDAFAINAGLPELLAEETRRRNIHFIHVSTDGIFDGDGTPHTERATPRPANVYARSKLIGEQKVMAANSGALIVRTCIYGWSCTGRESLAEVILNQLASGKVFTGFTDVFFNPLHVGTISALMLDLANVAAHGLINLGSHDSLTKFAFARALADEFKLDAGLIRPGKLADISFVARRPNYTVLDCGRATELLGHAMPGNTEGIKAMRDFRDEGMRHKLKQWGTGNGHNQNR
jgi:dTDP-4-dehydrorhamnose reductase